MNPDREFRLWLGKHLIKTGFDNQARGRDWLARQLNEIKKENG